MGTGEKILRLDPEIHSYLKKHNILLEVQDTVSYIIPVLVNMLVFFAHGHFCPQVRPSKGGSDVTLSLIFHPTCRLYGLRQILLSQIVAFLPSVSVGCRCSGTRLSLHF